MCKVAKRGNGEGSVYQRADGKWCAAVVLPGGRRRVLYGKTRKDAAAKLHAAQDNVKRSLPLPPARETVGAFLARWLRDVAAVKVRRTTFRRYELDVNRHIAPLLGSLKLVELTPQHVQQLIGALSAQGLSPRSITHCRAVLRVAPQRALKDGLVGQNVAKLVDVPRQAEKRVRALGPDDARRILAAFAGDDFEPLIVLALATGMRQGELLGLSWEDVDLDVGGVRVRRQLQRIGGAYELTELKTGRSQRALPLPAIAVDALRAQRVWQAELRLLLGPGWVDRGLVFTTARGDYLSGSVVTHHFRARLAKAGIEPMPFHNLRHGAASLLLAQGADMRRVMEQLGHSTITLTANTYAHVIPALMKDNADLLQRALGGAEHAAV
jgi:integrase